MAQEIDDAAVLAYLKAKRAALDASIASLEAALGQPPSADPAPQGTPLAGGKAAGRDHLGPGVFHGMSISEAAKKYFEITKKKQKVRAICDALQEGGIESSSKNFYNNVYTTLDRTKDFIRLGKYWALAEWHPNAATPKPKKATRRVTMRKASKPQATTASKQKVLPISASGDKAETA
jgi:hypothetical protein